MSQVAGHTQRAGGDAFRECDRRDGPLTPNSRDPAPSPWRGYAWVCVTVTHHSLTQVRKAALRTALIPGGLSEPENFH